MKMSVKRRLGFVHVQGGRIMAVATPHPVMVSTYNSDPDMVQGIRRQFSGPLVFAKIGDLAVEICTAGTKRILGHAYLSGDAINLVRFADSGNRDPGAFTERVGIKFAIPPHADRACIEAVIDRVRRSPADIATASVMLLPTDMMHVVETLTHSIRSTHCEESTVDVMIRISDGRRLAVLHLQTVSRRQMYCAQPFMVDVVHSSPELGRLLDADSMAKDKS